MSLKRGQAILLVAGAWLGGCGSGAPASHWDGPPQPTAPFVLDCPEGTTQVHHEGPNGTELTCRDVAGLLQGPRLLPSDDGQRARFLGGYRDSEYDGRHYAWENGKPRSHLDYRRGKWHGEYRMFLTDRSPPETAWVERWANGERHGVWAAWHPNGQQRYEREFCHDLACGTWRQWDDTGQLLYETTFGEQEFTDYQWMFDTRHPQVIGTYQHGKPTGEWIWFDEEGRQLQMCTLVDDRFEQCQHPDQGPGWPMPP